MPDVMDAIAAEFFGDRVGVTTEPNVLTDWPAFLAEHKAEGVPHYIVDENNVIIGEYFIPTAGYWPTWEDLIYESSKYPPSKMDWESRYTTMLWDTHGLDRRVPRAQLISKLHSGWTVERPEFAPRPPHLACPIERNALTSTACPYRGRDDWEVEVHLMYSHPQEYEALLGARS